MKKLFLIALALLIAFTSISCENELSQEAKEENTGIIMAAQGLFTQVAGSPKEQNSTSVVYELTEVKKVQQGDNEISAKGKLTMTADMSKGIMKMEFTDVEVTYNKKSVVRVGRK